jgi:hypothetical protein
MTSGPKTEVVSGIQISDGELGDADLDKVAGGDVSVAVEPLSQQFVDKIISVSNMKDAAKAGAAAGAAGAATGPKPT